MNQNEITRMTQYFTRNAQRYSSYDNQNEITRMTQYFTRNAQKYSSYDTELGIILKKLVQLCEKSDYINLSHWSVIYNNVLLSWLKEEEENA